MSAAVFVLSPIGMGCGVNVDANIGSNLQQAIDQLSSQSAAWQQTLIQLEAQLNKDASNLAHQVLTQVQILLQGTLAATGDEARCDADFLGVRVRQALENLKAQLVDHQSTTPNPPAPHVCLVVPNNINVADINSGTVSTVEVHGYDLQLGTDPEHSSRPGDFFLGGYNDSSSSILPYFYYNNWAKWVASPSPYLLTVNVSAGNGLPFFSGQSKLEFLNVVEPGAPSAPGLPSWLAPFGDMLIVRPATQPGAAGQTAASQAAARTHVERVSPASKSPQELRNLSITFTNMTAKAPKTGVTVDIGKGIADWAQPAPAAYAPSSVITDRLTSVPVSSQLLKGQAIKICAPGASGWRFDWSVGGRDGAGGTYTTGANGIELSQSRTCYEGRLD
jgi:hypothetical protein